MIDLHCHILPGMDDGASDLSISIEMARRFVEDGVSVVACTPHILPGLYHNTGSQIRSAVDQLQDQLLEEGISLHLVTGADNHVDSDFVAKIRSGHLLTLANSRYILVEPPHHVVPPRLKEFFFDIMAHNYIPILTHPERLTWLKDHYDDVKDLVRAGAWMQITSGSLTGSFGRNAQYWAERMLDEGCVHLLATDAHNIDRRPPNLLEGRRLAAEKVGEAQAEHMVMTRPLGVLRNDIPSRLPKPSAVSASGQATTESSRSSRVLDNRNNSGVFARIQRLRGR
jgi:protein-tyrosine phosphatase